MPRRCYFHDTPLVTAHGHTACPDCGMSYPFLPDPANSASVSAVAGHLVGDLAALLPLDADPFLSPSGDVAVLSDAAPGLFGSLPSQVQAEARHQTQKV